MPININRTQYFCVTKSKLFGRTWCLSLAQIFWHWQWWRSGLPHYRLQELAIAHFSICLDAKTLAARFAQNLMALGSSCLLLHKHRKDEPQTSLLTSFLTQLLLVKHCLLKTPGTPNLAPHTKTNQNSTQRTIRFSF